MAWRPDSSWKHRKCFYLSSIRFYLILGGDDIHTYVLLLCSPILMIYTVFTIISVADVCRQHMTVIACPPSQGVKLSISPIYSSSHIHFIHESIEMNYNLTFSMNSIFFTNFYFTKFIFQYSFLTF